MEITRRNAIGLTIGAAVAAKTSMAAAESARNLGSKSKTLFWVASVTPCDKALKFDPGAFKDVMAWFKHEGADGVVVLGTTGEYPSFSMAERKQVMDVAGRNKNGLNIICSTGTSNFPETIELSKHAADHGAEGVLVIPPFYYKNPPLEGLVRYYSLLFDAVPGSLAVNLYHIPSLSAVPISTELLNALKHYPNLAGIKDSEEDMPDLFAIREGLPRSQHAKRHRHQAGICASARYGRDPGGRKSLHPPDRRCVCRPPGRQGHACAVREVSKAAEL